MKLERVRRIARAVESEDGIRSDTEINPAIDGVQIRDVHPVEQVEKISDELSYNAFTDPDLTGDTQIHSHKVIPRECVAAKVAGTIRQGIAVAIGVQTSKDIEPAAGLRCEDRTEFEVFQKREALGNLAHKSQRESVGHALTRNGALIRDTRALPAGPQDSPLNRCY